MFDPSITSTEQKDQHTHDRSRVALIAQLEEQCTGNAKVVDWNPVKSLKIFSSHFSSGFMATFASIIMSSFSMFLCLE